MPKLPDVQELRPTPQGGRGVYSVPVAESGLKTLGEAITKFTTEHQERQNKMQTANAQAEWMKAQVETESALDNDTDYSTYHQRYSDALGQAKERILGTMTDPNQKKYFAAQMDMDFVRGSERVLDKTRSAERDVGRASIDEMLDQNRKMLASTTDPEQRKTLMKQLETITNLSYTNKYHSMEDSAKLLREAKSDRAEDWLTKQPHTEMQGLVKGTTYKIDDPVDAKVLALESGGDVNAKNPTSSATGPFQITDGTAKEWGIAPEDRNDFDKSYAAYKRGRAKNEVQLEKSLGRAPVGDEVYLAHQQGAAGAAALLKAGPLDNAINALVPAYAKSRDPVAAATKAIKQNGGDDATTAKEFVDMWKKRYASIEPTTEVNDFAKTGTPFDDLSPDKQTAYLKGLPTAIHQERENEKQAVVDALAPLVQAANGDYTKIPPDLRAQAINAGVWDKVQDYKGEDIPAVKAKLLRLPPDELAKVNLDSADYRFALTQATHDSLQEKQQAIMNNPVEGMAMKQKDTIMRTALQEMAGKRVKGTFGTFLGMQPSDSVVVHLNDMVDYQVAAFKQANKRNPDNSELRSIVYANFMHFDSLDGKSLMETTIDDVPKEYVKQMRPTLQTDTAIIAEWAADRQQQDAVKAIPPAELAKIDATLASRGKQFMNDQERLRLYEAKLNGR